MREKGENLNLHKLQERGGCSENSSSKIFAQVAFTVHGSFETLQKRNAEIVSSKLQDFARMLVYSRDM